MVFIRSFLEFEQLYIIGITIVNDFRTKLANRKTNRDNIELKHDGIRIVLNCNSLFYILL